MRLRRGATAMLAGAAAPAGESSATKSEVARSGGNVSVNPLPAQGRRVWAGGLTLIAALALQAPRVSAAPGGLDPSFGQGGMGATFMSGHGSARAHAIAAAAGSSRAVGAGTARVV